MPALSPPGTASRVRSRCRGALQPEHPRRSPCRLPPPLRAALAPAAGAASAAAAAGGFGAGFFFFLRVREARSSDQSRHHEETNRAWFIATPSASLRAITAENYWEKRQPPSPADYIMRKFRISRTKSATRLRCFTRPRSLLRLRRTAPRRIRRQRSRASRRRARPGPRSAPGS